MKGDARGQAIKQEIQRGMATVASGARQMAQPKQRYTTTLNPAEEAAFRQWMTGQGFTRQGGYNVDDNLNGGDYDYRGFFKQYGPVRIGRGQHLTDEFKLPTHETFSNESNFAQSFPDNAGSWTGDTYNPPARRFAGTISDLLPPAPHALGTRI